MMLAASDAPQIMASGEHLNREAWLAKLVELLRPRFAAAATLPEIVAVSCSWPSRGGTSSSRRVTGQCWNAKTSTLGRPEVFISPTLDQALEVAPVLVHELIHAALPEAGHGREFKRAATALGLEGPMRATIPSARLLKELPGLLERLGPYPHGRINLGDHPGAAGPIRPTRCPSNTKQGTRLLKVVCPGCGYVVRTTAKWLSHGAPTCPCTTLMRFSGEGVTIDAAL
jgi:hypothetical protein